MQHFLTIIAVVAVGAFLGRSIWMDIKKDRTIEYLREMYRAKDAEFQELKKLYSKVLNSKGGS